MESVASRVEVIISRAEFGMGCLTSMYGCDSHVMYIITGKESQIYKNNPVELEDIELHVLAFFTAQIFNRQNE